MGTTRKQNRERTPDKYSNAELLECARGWRTLNEICNGLTEEQLWFLLSAELERETLRKKSILRIFARIRSIETKVLREGLEKAIERNDHETVKKYLESA